ncbi:MAG: ribosome maturation factor RimP, partial [Epulopiscium sp.]|nr:ribosome maturation factor RimP [Candidatus Epulonipiscium sp.]
MIKGNQTEKKVTELLLPILEKENFELVDVEFVKEGP